MSTMPFTLTEQPYSDIHHLSSTREPTEDDLKAIIRTFPLIDNHAHNLLREEEAYSNIDYPFESITSEAQGHALQEHVHSTLAHIRGIRQLAELFDCPPSLQDVKAARYEWVLRDYDSLIKKCLTGTHALLLDDGLPQDSVYPVQWHGQHAPTVRRIARIEAVAAELLEQLAHAAGLLAPGVDMTWPIDKTEAFLVRFNTMFRNQIKTLAGDPTVCGFKSVVCYRAGLDVSLSSHNAFRPHQALAGSDLLLAFHEFLRKAVGEHNYRVEEKQVNDFLVVAACDVLSKLVETEGETVPIQFHTGLGDIDIDLIKANPAYMQPLIEVFPNVDFVILHSSYPYTREAGYLAANFANAWLDIGEVFPMISRQGQQSVLRQVLELTPASKILWSTDGHFYPETFYLANRQFRDALEVVLGELVAAQDLTVVEAINVSVDVLFWNSNSLYKLDEERRHPQLLRACGRTDGGSQRTTLVNRESGSSHHSNVSQDSTTHAGAGLDSATTTAVPSPSTQRTRRRGPSLQSIPQRTNRRPVSDPFTNDHIFTMTNGASNDQAAPLQPSRSSEDTTIFDSFMSNNPHVKYIWLQFQSSTGTTRNRMVPVKTFRKQLSMGKSIGVTKALTRLLANELPAAGCVATGEFQLLPDLTTLCLNKGIGSPSASVQTWWMDEVNAGRSGIWDRCPRSALDRQAQTLSDEFGLSVLLGIEIEVIFMRPIKEGSVVKRYNPASQIHSWSNMTHEQIDSLPMIEEIVEQLSDVGIEVEQFHAEAAPGQWEFPLPPARPLKAIDMFYKARETITNIAKQYGLRATYYPRPYAAAPGSASHTHFSINGTSETVEEYADSFLAGVLHHLSSIMAFSLPLEESYARIASGVWSGSEWITWGTQNREAPIRKCGSAHWELKTIDGIGNMYLSTTALLAAGLLGLRNNMPLKHKDNPVDASTLSDSEREEHGITQRLPNSLETSLGFLSKDEELQDVVGKSIVEDYIAVKKAEMDFLNSMDEDARKLWLMERW